MSDIHDALRTHIEASLRVKELQTECARLRDGGKIRKARRVLAQIEETQARMKALEDAMLRGKQ